jgi:hypothetical protein
MAFKHTADQMVESIKSRIRIPVSQSTYTKAKILSLIDEELERHVVPKIMACRENYFMYEEDTTLVNGQQEYKIPYRAIGGKFKTVKYLNAQSQEQRMKQVPYENVYIYQDGDYNEPLFYIKRNSIVIVPTTNNYGSGSIRWGYYLKPSAVIEVSAAAKVASINTVSKVVTTESTPSTITSSTLVDIVRGKGGFECLAIDQTVTVSGTSITFSSLPTDLAAGDYICLAQESPFPQIPADIHSYLTLRVCKVILEGLGFFKEAEIIQKDLKEAESVFDTMLTPRTEGNPKKIMNFYSPLRR